MSNEIGRPWYKNPRILIPLIQIFVAAIIGATYAFWLNAPSSDFSISINPMNGQVQQGGVITTAITVKGEYGYKESVSLSGSGQPPGVVITFAPPIGGLTPSYTSIVKITISLDAPVGKYEITIKGLGADGKERSVKYILDIMPKGQIFPTPLLSPSPTPPPTAPPVVIKITSPEDGNKAPISNVVSGTISDGLPQGQYMWVVINPQKAPGLWWPQGGRITLSKGRWDVQAWLGIEQDIGTEFDIAVILVNEKDNQYYNNYLETGQRTGSFPGIPLPPSAKIMDRI